MTTTGLFEATLGDQSLDEALANLELDARLYGWPRAEVRACASRIRLRFARKRDPR
jgi:hypothetical protein